MKKRNSAGRLPAAFLFMCCSYPFYYDIFMADIPYCHSVRNRPVPAGKGLLLSLHLLLQV